MGLVGHLTTLARRSSVLGLAFLLFAASLAAQAPGPSDVGSLRMRIETDQQSYYLGDSVMVRLTLRNTSDRPILFQNGTYTVLARLTVLDDAGRLVEPTISALGGRASGPARTLKAGGELRLLHWRSPPRREWLNLRDWGYDLRTPGKYTIVGIPGLGGPELPEASRMRSNEATFTIE